MSSSRISLKKISTIATAIPLFALFGCDFSASATDSTTESSSSVVVPPPNQDGLTVVSTLEDLLNCTKKREGDMAFVSKQNAIYVCSNERWNKADIVLSSSSTQEPDIESSSSLDTIIIQPPYSSSYDPIIIIPPAPGCFETWNGSDGVYQIQTGFDNGTETSGYWFTYGDDADGGASQIIWPVPLGNEYSSFAIDPVIDACGGLCATFNLNKGTLSYNPYVGVGFNIAGVDESGAATAVNASSMGGIEVTYVSDIALSVEMGLTAQTEAAYDYDLPIAALPRTSTPITKRIPWSSFKQAGWGKHKITGDQAAQMLATIRFRFQGRDGLTGTFNIISIGAYNQEECVHQPPIQSSSSYIWPILSSSSHQTNPNIAECGAFETWNGNEGIYKISTGCDDMTESGGYWFEYNDSMDGGLSKITWPAPKGNEYAEDAMDNIIDFCGGLCGTYELDKGDLYYQPYVGVGFEYAGREYESGDLYLADASYQEGVCITYTSDAPAVLEMSLGDVKDAELGYDVPFVNLPKASVGTTKRFTWSQFKQAGWGQAKITGQDAAKSIGSLRFKIQGKDKSVGTFNITSVGPYNGSCGGIFYVY